MKEYHAFQHLKELKIIVFKAWAFSKTLCIYGAILVSRSNCGFILGFNQGYSSLRPFLCFTTNQFAHKLKFLPN